MSIRNKNRWFTRFFDYHQVSIYIDQVMLSVKKGSPSRLFLFYQLLFNDSKLSTFESKKIHKKRNSCFHRIPMIWNLQWLTRYSLEDWRKWSDTVWLELPNESPFCYLAVQIEIFELAELINWNLNICFGWLDISLALFSRRATTPRY